MKILKGVFYFILLLFVLFCILIVICGFRPDMTDVIVQFLYPKQSQENTQQANAQLEASFAESGNPVKTSTTSQSMDSLEEKPSGILSDYSAPSQSELNIPSEVSGKNGYQKIVEQGTEIAEEEAKRLQNQLTLGSVGDGLTFDARFYPYYAMLNDAQKHLYRQIYANANDLFPVFAPVETISPSSLKDVFSAVYNDHPELFWLETAYSYKYLNNGNCIALGLEFNRTSNNLEAEKATFTERANLILAKVQTITDVYEQEKAVHDLLLEQLIYSAGAEMNQSAYSAMVNGQTVCAGYARAYQYLLQQLSIPCYYCTGFAGENHAWNIVELEGEYYNVDTTWNDTDPETYDYFNKTDSDYATTHIRQDLSVYLPPCNGERFRNLEPETELVEVESKRNISDLNINENQIIRSLDAYYEDCSTQITQNGIGNFTFYNVIDGYDLLEQCVQSYDTDDYLEGYMNATTQGIGGSVWKILYEAEELQNGLYLFKHEITIW